MISEYKGAKEEGSTAAGNPRSDPPYLSSGTRKSLQQDSAADNCEKRGEGGREGAGEDGVKRQNAGVSDDFG